VHTYSGAEKWKVGAKSAKAAVAAVGWTPRIEGCVSEGGNNEAKEAQFG
jgi:hypothetical protein